MWAEAIASTGQAQDNGQVPGLPEQPRREGRPTSVFKRPPSRAPPTAPGLIPTLHQSSTAPQYPSQTTAGCAILATGVNSHSSGSHVMHARTHAAAPTANQSLTQMMEDTPPSTAGVVCQVGAVSAGIPPGDTRPYGHQVFTAAQAYQTHAPGTAVHGNAGVAPPASSDSTPQYDLDSQMYMCMRKWSSF